MKHHGVHYTFLVPSGVSHYLKGYYRPAPATPSKQLYLHENGTIG
jgi:hypothetical protein